MTWSAQRRKKTTAKTTIASTPNTASLSAICGVKRYGSSTRGSGGRKLGTPGPRSRMVLDTGRHTLPADAGDLRREDPRAEPVERIGEQHVERQGGQQDAEEEVRGRHGQPQHEVEDRRAERDPDRPEGDRDQQWVRGGPRRELAEPARPVSGDGEEQRCQPEGAERRGVEHEADP